MADKNGVTFDLVSYNTIMSYYCNINKFKEAKEIFYSLPEKQIIPNSNSYSTLIRGLLHNKEDDAVENGMNIFRKYVRSCDDKDIFVYNSILQLLQSHKEFDLVDNIVEGFKKEDSILPNETTFNTLIKGFCKMKNLD